MAFDEVRFPESIAKGSRGGPRFNTSIIDSPSGADQRISRWATPRWVFDARYGIRSYEMAYEVVKFYIARVGPARGFRMKDYADFTTASDDRSAHAHDDVNIGVGDGARTQWRLQKRYSSGPSIVLRLLYKPIAATVMVGLNGVDQAAGWSVDDTTGLITFSVAPVLGQVVSAGCEFDVPVRFGDEIDTGLLMSLDAYDGANLPSVPMIEDLGGDATPELEYHGGAFDHGEIASDVTMSLGKGRVQVFSPQVTSRRAILPQPSDIAPGGPVFYVVNQGIQALGLYEQTNTTQLRSISAGVTAPVYLAEDSAGLRSWVAG